VILLIDNYDSFVYNLKQYLAELGEEVTVRRNDRITGAEALEMAPDRIVISPGPGTPEEAGNSIEIIRTCAGKIPVLGVCLGHQTIGAAFGARIVRARELVHGKTSPIAHDGKTIFAGLDNPFPATRYHSLAIEEESLPGELAVSARAPDGEVMAVRHRSLPLEGVQFHPESIISVQGKKLLYNFLAGKTEQIPIREAIDTVISGRNLSRREAADVMETIMNGDATAAQISAFVTGLRLKGETVEEISGCAEIMRRKAVAVRAPAGRTVVDTCGTGGDKSNTFNISTAAALIAAGAGVTVAKHGNRSVSSACGSADVLTALGVDVSAPPAVMEACLEEAGVAFLFAPTLHGAMKHAIGPRREIGIRTVFNILGPLANPAGADVQLLGVYAEELTEIMARVLASLGSRRAWVVHGLDGLDEITLTQDTVISRLEGGKVNTFRLDPGQYGLDKCRPDEIKGGAPERNAEIVLEILRGEPGPRTDIAVLNAGAAIMLGEAARGLEEGIEMARDALRSGAAMHKLEELRRLTSTAAKPGKRP